MAGDATVPCTAKLRLFAKRRGWGVSMHVRHPSDARLLCRVDDSRCNHQTCDGAAVAMVGSRESVQLDWSRITGPHKINSPSDRNGDFGFQDTNENLSTSRI